MQQLCDMIQRKFLVGITPVGVVVGTFLDNIERSVVGILLDLVVGAELPLSLTLLGVRLDLFIAEFCALSGPVGAVLLSALLSRGARLIRSAVGRPRCSGVRLARLARLGGLVRLSRLGWCVRLGRLGRLGGLGRLGRLGWCLGLDRLGWRLGLGGLLILLAGLVVLVIVESTVHRGIGFRLLVQSVVARVSLQDIAGLFLNFFIPLVI